MNFHHESLSSLKASSHWEAARTGLLSGIRFYCLPSEYSPALSLSLSLSLDDGRPTEKARNSQSVHCVVRIDGSHTEYFECFGWLRRYTGAHETTSSLRNLFDETSPVIRWIERVDALRCNRSAMCTGENGSYPMTEWCLAIDKTHQVRNCDFSKWLSYLHWVTGWVTCQVTLAVPDWQVTNRTDSLRLFRLRLFAVSPVTSLQVVTFCHSSVIHMPSLAIGDSNHL